VRPEVHSFPVSDTAFRTAVLRAVDRVLTEALAPGDEIESTRELLRQAYPNVQIVRRDDMSGYETSPVWYAFRDGRVRPRDPDRERLYSSLSSARETIDKSTDALEHAKRAARSAGYR
jgi:hypothetical protein